ncbi:MAG: hypothetical protein ACK4UN_11895, partial [Limisphaerales bacterium]
MLKRLAFYLALLGFSIAYTNTSAVSTNYFTELFSSLDNDLAHKSFTFTPDGSNEYYAVCRQSATNFPTDPAGGTFLNLGDDDFATIVLSGTNTVAVYSFRTNRIHVGSNGYITFQSGDSNFSESLTGHFMQPRISALFDDLHPHTNSVSWKALSNRVAITYLNVRERGLTNTNSFQVELFFEGTIRITYLKIDARDGLTGLSAGGGIPPNFVESDFSSFPTCSTNMLFLSIPSSSLEGSIGVTGQITLPVALQTNLTVSLASSDPTEVTVPGNVVIPAGNTSVSFPLTIVDDLELDGTQFATVTASAPGFVGSSRTIAILDNETATLQLLAPTQVNEGHGLVEGTIRSSAPPTSDIEVQLHSSDVSKIIVPPKITLPTGQTSAPFSMTIVDDSMIDENRAVAVSATVPNWTAATTQIVVLDNEHKNLMLQIPAYASEGVGVITNGGHVSISGTLTSNLLVSLVSSDTTELVVPSSITIPAGSTSAAFNLTIVDDALLDGQQLVTISAAAAGFVTGSGQITVYDNESPAPAGNPQPAHLQTNINAVTILSWNTNDGSSHANTYEVYFGTSPVLTAAHLLGSTTNTFWELALLAPQTTYYWQIVTRREGQTASPVWHFTTRGVYRFQFDAIPALHEAGNPFPITIRAVDELNRPVTNFTGQVNLKAVVGTNETMRILSFTGFADLVQEYPRTIAAIRNHFTDFVEISTGVTNVAVLQNLLADKHLFLVVEQENATAVTLSNLATNWSVLLSNFTFNGGSVIACSYQSTEHLLLS